MPSKAKDFCSTFALLRGRSKWLRGSQLYAVKARRRSSPQTDSCSATTRHKATASKKHDRLRVSSARPHGAGRVHEPARQLLDSNESSLIKDPGRGRPHVLRLRRPRLPLPGRRRHRYVHGRPGREKRITFAFLEDVKRHFGIELRFLKTRRGPLAQRGLRPNFGRAADLLQPDPSSDDLQRVQTQLEAVKG